MSHLRGDVIELEREGAVPEWGFRIERGGELDWIGLDNYFETQNNVTPKKEKDRDK